MNHPEAPHEVVAGFTLIELLVVIAIIGLLSSIVLASLSTARQKGTNAAIESDLISLRNQAELFSGTSNNFNGVCADRTPGVLNILDQIRSVLGAGYSVTRNSGLDQNSTMVYCDDATSYWVVQSPLSGGGYWCVDSNGLSKAEPAPLAHAATHCL